jgi:hypothetical protein
MKIHQSVPTSSRAATLLAIVAFGVATGVLWPVNGFLLKFSGAFVAAVLATVTIAGLVWCAIKLYVLVCPFIKLFEFQKKEPLVQSHVTHRDMTPASTEKAGTRDEVLLEKWIGVATLSGVAALWLLLVGWGIAASSIPFIVYSGWGAVSCVTAAFALSVIAGAYGNDDVETLVVVVAIAGALFTIFVLIGLFALV